MFKDDRMISILSGIVLMLAVGTLVQRQDMVSEFLGGDGQPNVIALRPDAISVAPDTLTRIDVLSNDENLTRADYDRLEVLSQPGCGRVFVQGEALQFLAELDCEATQTFQYTLAELDEDIAPGDVTVNVRGATGTRNAPEPAATEGLALLDPQTPTTTEAPEPAARREDAADAAAAPAMPRIVIPTTPAVSAPSAPAPAPAASAAPVPAAPRPGTAAPSGIGSPAAPSAGFGTGLAAAESGSGQSGLPSSGIAVSTTGGAPAAPASPGAGAPVAPGGLAALAPPASPSVGGLAAPSSPSAPGAPSLGGGFGAPSLPGTSAPGQPSGSAPAAPPALALRDPAEPTAPSVPSIGLQMPQPGASRVARIDGSSSTVVGAGAGQPSGIARTATPTLALARVEVPTAAAAPRPSSVGGAGLELAGPSVGGPEGVDVTAGSNDSAGAAVAFAEPSAGLGDIINMRDMMASIPLLDTSGPEALATPPRGGEDEELRLGALTPGTQSLDPESAVPGSGVDSSRPEIGETPESFDVARLPTTDLACVVPPSVTLDVRAAGETDLIITSPCHADSVAEVDYANMQFGVEIDRAGRGQLLMFGFEASTEASIEFEDGESISFDIPFTGVERTERVAVAWDDPVQLNLHALEFGAERGGDGHVRPDVARDFRSVRRRGGGYMKTFAPVRGVGQYVQIYSHWIRRGGKAGVVQMYLDYSSRDVDGLEGTCGTGELARPSFKVIRSSRGRVEDPNVRRLAAVDCDDVATGESVLIGAAVRDIIISQR